MFTLQLPRDEPADGGEHRSVVAPDRTCEQHRFGLEQIADQPVGADDTQRADESEDHPVRHGVGLGDVLEETQEVAAELAKDDLVDEGVLRFELAVQGDSRQLRTAGDLLHRGALDAGAAELFVGGIEQAHAGLVDLGTHDGFVRKEKCVLKSTFQQRRRFGRGRWRGG
ncbi:hypothetical protein NJ76_25700 [Rhodococcus sp. IITR03]|nr:hypothetical protein NJ76_25700 [Rhodococcus sp. IITR03]